MTETGLTAIIFATAAAIIFAMVRLEKRTRTDFQPSLIPTTPIMLVSGLVALLALVHLANLYGIQTGR
jgi:energy-converting hydrogenase Eha subunit A